MIKCIITKGNAVLVLHKYNKIYFLFFLFIFI